MTRTTSTQERQSQVGFIGLGVMGQAMCLNLARKLSTIKPDAELHVYDQNSERSEVFKAMAVRICESANEILARCELVFLSLPSGVEIAQLLDLSAGRRKTGQWIIDCGTTSVIQTKAIAEALSKESIIWIDAPVARTREAAIKGQLAMMVGASPEQFDTIKPILATMASDISHCGALGTGQLCKILNNMILFQTVEALASAAAISEAYGLEAEMLFSILSQGSADSFALRNHGLKAIAPRVFPESAFPVSYAQKDLSYALELAESLGIRCEGAQTVDHRFDLAIKNGLSNHYFPVIRSLYK